MAVAERASLLRDELETFIRITSSTMNPDLIIVFGSLAHGDVHEWSDLDVVLVMESDLPFLGGPGRYSNVWLRE